MENSQGAITQTDILDTIKKIRTLITEEKPEELKEPLDTLADYVYFNLPMLNEDKELRQQVANALLLGAKQSLAKFPEKGINYHTLAISYFLNDNIQELCRCMTAFIESDNKHGGEPFSYNDFLMYIAFFFSNLYDKEQQIFTDAMMRTFERHYPDTALTYYLKSFSTNLDAEHVLQYLSKTIAIDKDFLEAHYGIASIYYGAKNWKNAIAYYNKCVDLRDTGADLFFDLAWCYGKIKDTDNEIIYYKKCLEIDPTFRFALNNLGWAYQKAKDFDNALSYFQQSIALGKDGKYPYRNAFKLLKKLKRYDEAIEFFEANKKRLPKSSQNDVEKMHEAINRNFPQLDLPYSMESIESVEDEADIIAEAPEETRASKIPKTTGKSFLSESRLEDEIEDRLNRGIPFYNLPLRVYEGKDGYGRQYIIPGVGRIDLLAVSTLNNDYYVIELKRGQGDDEIVGQVSRYMGWVKKNLASSDQNVYGIICVEQATEKLNYAADANPNISIFNYSFQITPA